MPQGGQRIKLQLPESINSLPLISIITVVRNSEELLELTILNVLNQNYENIEYIIIDGNSTDRTLDIIRKYEDKITYWISEPDNGIYDAMNKGIALARGTWLNFMNAGDEFYTNDVCKKFSSELLTDNSDVVYGDVVAHNQTSKSELLIKAKSQGNIWKGMIFSHQSCFLRSNVGKIYLFNLKYKLAADFDQFLTLSINKYRFCYLPITVSKVRIGGLSYSNNRTIVEQISIINSRRPYSPRLLYFCLLYIMNMFSALFGKKTTGLIRKLKWRYLSKSNLCHY